jgi:hypothetical protein
LYQTLLTLDRKHLFVDLRPYTCLFASCAFTKEPFANRQLWVDHLELEHELGPDWNGVQCPLCLESTGSGKSTILIHFARHMEDIAIASLPRDVESDVESGSGSSLDSLSAAEARDGSIDTAQEAEAIEQERNPIDDETEIESKIRHSSLESNETGPSQHEQHAPVSASKGEKTGYHSLTIEQAQAIQAQYQEFSQGIQLQQLPNQQMNGMLPGSTKPNLQQMAMHKAQMHVQSQGIPAGQNPQLYQQRLAQGYFQQLKQAQAAQAQQQNTQQQAMNQMSPQGPQNAIPNQQAPNNMANMSVAQLRSHYQQRKQHLLTTFGNQVPQQHVQQMHQLEQLIRSKEQAQAQAQQQMGQNQMPMNQGMQGQIPGGQNPMQMQQYQQALLQQRAQQQRNDQIMRMRQQALQQGGQMPQGMMNNMQGMNMGQMNMGNMQGMNMQNMQNMQGMQGMQGMNMGQMNQQQIQQMMMMRQAQQQRMQQQGGGDMNWSGV